MLTVRKVAATVGAMAIASGAAVVVFSSGPQAAQASPTPTGCTKTQGTITCVTTESSQPHRNWTQTVTTSQKGNFDAQGGHESQTNETNANPAGKLPAGQQP